MRVAIINYRNALYTTTCLEFPLVELNGLGVQEQNDHAAFANTTSSCVDTTVLAPAAAAIRKTAWANLRSYIQNAAKYATENSELATTVVPKPAIVGRNVGSVNPHVK
jgi:hypothetical protein